MKIIRTRFYEVDQNEVTINNAQKKNNSVRDKISAEYIVKILQRLTQTKTYNST